MFNKTEEQYFKDWESAVFGYGYGSGEEHTLKSLKNFLDSFEHKYDFQVLEKKLGGEITWLLINILAKNNIIEYGTSPRFGWLTSSGDMLQAFIKKHSVDELCEIIANDDEYEQSSFAYCDFSFCNCFDEQMSGVCRNNPFLNEKVAYEIRYKTN